MPGFLPRADRFSREIKVSNLKETRDINRLNFWRVTGCATSGAAAAFRNRNNNGAISDSEGILRQSSDREQKEINKLENETESELGLHL